MSANDAIVIMLAIIMSIMMAALGAFLVWAFGAPPWVSVISACVLGGFTALRFLTL